MAAPKKNTNARKWTEERVYGYLTAIEEAVSQPDCLFLGQVLEGLGLYRDIWAYWRRRFPESEDLRYRMELIEATLESHLYEASLRGEIPASIAIICLRHVYRWREFRQAEPELYEMVWEDRDEAVEYLARAA